MNIHYAQLCMWTVEGAWLHGIAAAETAHIAKRSSQPHFSRANMRYVYHV